MDMFKLLSVNPIPFSKYPDSSNNFPFSVKRTNGNRDGKDKKQVKMKKA
jgi:hypothetical protein